MPSRPSFALLNAEKRGRAARDCRCAASIGSTPA
jgi:hypothetical protein